jgi:aconitate hydratase
VRAVLASSFERIHRSNLIGMGILPLRLPAGRHPAQMKIAPADRIEIDADLSDIKPCSSVAVTIRRSAGTSEQFKAVAALETASEIDLLRAGGMLPLILSREVPG